MVAEDTQDRLKILILGCHFGLVSLRPNYFHPHEHRLERQRNNIFAMMRYLNENKGVPTSVAHRCKQNEEKQKAVLHISERLLTVNWLCIGHLPTITDKIIICIVMRIIGGGVDDQVV